VVVQTSRFKKHDKDIGICETCENRKKGCQNIDDSLHVYAVETCSEYEEPPIWWEGGEIMEEPAIYETSRIIRRVDDLGCIFIPKEIRRALQIHEGDPMEIIVNENGILLKKYEPSE